MTTKNSLLLMVKQNPGIDYNSLLNKFSANYSNINSARAALSRSLKDLLIFGFVRKQQNSFFATDKAVLLVNSEMKNKLVLKLNQVIASKKPETEINLIVQRLSTLIERAKHDAGLLKAAKGSVSFSVSDLEKIEKKIHEQTSHLNYMQKILRNQITTLSELDFNDVKKTDISKAQKIIEKLLEKGSFKEFLIETQNPVLAKKIESETGQKFKKNYMNINKNSIGKIFLLLEKMIPEDKNSVVFFLPPVKVSFKESNVYFSGPFSFISSL